MSDATHPTSSRSPNRADGSSFPEVIPAHDAARGAHQGGDGAVDPPEDGSPAQPMSPLQGGPVPASPGVPVPAEESGTGADDGDSGSESDILSPSKIIRIGAMLKQLLEEVRNTSLDEAAREQLSAIYSSSVSQLKSALSPDLGEELDALSFDFDDDSTPTEPELRMAQAQLVGWLEGLFHGIQAMMVAQQMAARQQLDGVRAELSERSSGGPPPGPGYI